MMRYLVLVLCLMFAVARFTMPATGTIQHDDIFKDLVHLFVGMLFGAAVLAYNLRAAVKSITTIWAPSTGSAMPEFVDSVLLQAGRFCLASAVGMTILEVIAFKLHQV